MPGSHTNSRPPWSVLAIGLWTTVAMWAIGYFALLRPGALLGEVLFLLMLACVLGGGYIGGRFAGGGWRTGLRIGLVAAGFNLLVVGSLIGDTSREGFMTSALVWVIGTLAGSALLGATGAALGARSAREGLESANWYAAFTRAVVAAAFLLLVSGAIVTGTDAGLAVPDWPNSFGHNMLLYPLTQMTSDEAVASGVHYEHAHRLYGMLVGLATITLAGTIFIADQRRAVRALCVIALAIVIVQGVLGGLRVTETSRPLAIIHGVNAQLVFAILVLIAGLISTAWRMREPVVRHQSVRTDRIMSIVLVAAIVLQLCIGATYRHLNDAPELNPAAVTGILHMHILVAAIVTGLVIFAGVRALSTYRAQPIVRRTGVAMKIVVAIQILLGIIAMIAVLRGEPGDPVPASEVVITTIHQATGAILFALAVLHLLWTRRLLEPA